MPVVIAVWPNNTISVVLMQPGFSMVSLFEELDQEACPTDAKCYVLRRDDDGAYATLDWDDANEDRVVTPESRGLSLEAMQGKLKRIKWPRDIVRRYYRSLYFSRGKSASEDQIKTMTADEVKQFPAEPDQTFTVDEVRRMEKFSGVYFAFNEDGSCHYVGEAIKVCERVSKSRPEIGSRRIGIIKCEPHDRKRIESYFIAMLDPPGNGASTHRMKSKQPHKETSHGR